MMAANSEKPEVDSFRLFPSSNDKTNDQFGFSFGLGFEFAQQSSPSLPPPPPSIEVLSSEVSSSVEHNVEPISVGNLTLLKGRVSTHQVFSLSNVDLVPGKYEGGLKLWEGSLDLIKSLHSQFLDGQLQFSRKRVLELGCGHGLPGIYACLQGSSDVHFQDFNAEVLRCLTIPNVNANLHERLQGVLEDRTESDIRYFAGDWREVHQLLTFASDNLSSISSKVPSSGYDIILMAETVYSISTLQVLYELIKKCIKRPDGVIYMAGKKHYFGVGGGTRHFLSIVEKDGFMDADLVAEVADGSSNMREVWKLSLK